ncbi:MAG: MarR family transcriptional regulator [Clostridia bacterium]|nr:MarR family transcriptional regulator [Clostridia bacterium]
MEDEIYFRESAEKLLNLMTKSQKKPVHRNARNLSMGEAGVMHCLRAKQEPMSAGEVGRCMDIGTGGVANLLNSLEKKGYVIRVMNPSDRRGIMVSLSDAGNQLIEEKQQEALNMTVGLLKRLGREDTEDLIRIYQKMLDIAEDYLRNHCKETE